MNSIGYSWHCNCIMVYMNCMRKSQHYKPVKATMVFSYNRTNAPKFFGVCGDCMETIGNMLKSNKTVKDLDSGAICPICDGTGFLRHYSHIDKGTCYRCNGKGHW